MFASEEAGAKQATKPCWLRTRTGGIGQFDWLNFKINDQISSSEEFEPIGKRLVESAIEESVDIRDWPIWRDVYAALAGVKHPITEPKRTWTECRSQHIYIVTSWEQQLNLSSMNWFNRNITKKWGVKYSLRWFAQRREVEITCKVTFAGPP